MTASYTTVPTPAGTGQPIPLSFGTSVKANLDAYLGNDTGVVSAATGWTISAGWTIGTTRYGLVGDNVMLSWSATRTGGTITGPATGNITDVNVFDAVPTILWPTTTARETYGNVSCSGQARLTNAGVIAIETLMPTATIVNTDVITGKFTYMLGV